MNSGDIIWFPLVLSAARRCAVSSSAATCRCERPTCTGWHRFPSRSDRSGGSGLRAAEWSLVAATVEGAARENGWWCCRQPERASEPLEAGALARGGASSRASDVDDALAAWRAGAAAVDARDVPGARRRHWKRPPGRRMRSWTIARAGSGERGVRHMYLAGCLRVWHWSRADAFDKQTSLHSTSLFGGVPGCAAALSPVTAWSSLATESTRTADSAPGKAPSGTTQS
eukprot:SAG22_NODE_138_length_18031_cov_5.796621_26_plen_228_part_00